MDRKLELADQEEGRETGMILRACNLPVQVAKLGGLCIQGQHRLHSEFKSSQGYIEKESLSLNQSKAEKDFFSFLH